MQQLKIFQQQLKPARQKLQQLSQWFVKFKKLIEKRPQVQRDRLFTLVLVLVLGFAGWYEYNDKARYFERESFPVITPRTAEDIEVGFDLIPSEHKRITSVAVDQNGTTIASSNEDGTLNLWNWQSDSDKKWIHSLRATEQKVKYVALSPNGRILASGNWDGTIQVWNWDDEKNTFNQAGEPLKASTKAVLSVAFSHDSQLLASGHSDGTIQLWNWDSEKKTLNKAGEYLQTGAEAVWSIAFSSDSQLLASGSDKGILKLWDVENRKGTRIPSADQSPIYSLAFSPVPNHSPFSFYLDNQQLASGSDDGTIKLWNIDSSKKLQGEPKILTPHNQLLSIALSKDGKILASGSDDGTIKLWNTLSGQTIRTLRSHP